VRGPFLSFLAMLSLLLCLGTVLLWGRSMRHYDHGSRHDGIPVITLTSSHGQIEADFIEQPALPSSHEWRWGSEAKDAGVFWTPQQFLGIGYRHLHLGVDVYDSIVIPD